MAGPAVDDALDGLVIEIPPNTITLAFDADGTPKTVPVEAEAPETPEPETPEAPVPALAELEQAKREREEAVRRAETAERMAREREQALTSATTTAETERTKRAEAERLAHDNLTRAAVAHYYRVNSELENAKTAITDRQAFLAQAQANLQAAHTDGDAARVARATSDIAKAEADINTLHQATNQWGYELDRAKRAYEEVAVKKPVDEPKPEPKKEADAPKQATPDDWIESVRGTAGDRVADWLKTNRQFVTDEKMNRRLLRFADEYVDDNGSGALRSDAFLEALNAKFLPKKEVEVTTETAKKEAEPQRTKVTPAAPVSRGGEVFSSANLNAGKIRLPADVVAFCKQAGLDPTSYALSVVEEIKRGEKPKEWLDPGYDRGIR